MSLVPGTTLGSYSVTAEVGAGGISRGSGTKIRRVNFVLGALLQITDLPTPPSCANQAELPLATARLFQLQFRGVVSRGS